MNGKAIELTFRTLTRKLVLFVNKYILNESFVNLKKK